MWVVKTGSLQIHTPHTDNVLVSLTQSWCDNGSPCKQNQNSLVDPNAPLSKVPISCGGTADIVPQWARWMCTTWSPDRRLAEHSESKLNENIHGNDHFGELHPLEYSHHHSFHHAARQADEQQTSTIFPANISPTQPRAADRSIRTWSNLVLELQNTEECLLCCFLEPWCFRHVQLNKIFLTWSLINFLRAFYRLF